MSKLLTIGRRFALGCGVAVLILGGQGEARAQADNAAPSQARTVNREMPRGEQAYSLPPEKLAQAIALNKIRVSLDIAGSVWGLIVIWGLLAFGGAARLE